MRLCGFILYLSLNRLFPFSLDGRNIALRRAPDGLFGIFKSYLLPPGAVDPVVGKRLNCGDHPAHSARRERNQVREAVHKADVAPVLDNIDDIARQQYAPTLSANRPMQNGPPWEMPAAADQGQAAG